MTPQQATTKTTVCVGCGIMDHDDKKRRHNTGLNVLIHDARNCKKKTYIGYSWLNWIYRNFAICNNTTKMQHFYKKNILTKPTVTELVSFIRSAYVTSYEYCFLDLLNFFNTTPYIFDKHLHNNTVASRRWWIEFGINLGRHKDCTGGSTTDEVHPYRTPSISAL